MPKRQTKVFPTGVGVNREVVSAEATDEGFPHRRGGEPLFSPLRVEVVFVFPTGVGVNRQTQLA